jgi:hypothetical protein
VCTVFPALTVALSTYTGIYTVCPVVSVVTRVMECTFFPVVTIDLRKKNGA